MADQNRAGSTSKWNRRSDCTSIGPTLPRFWAWCCDTADVDPTFDACLAAFDAVTERSRRAPDRVGLFADPTRMERFVGEFAGRYFDAHDAWREGRPATRSWVTAFDAAKRWRP